jgi:ATP-dependent RNA helicase HrpB
MQGTAPVIRAGGALFDVEVRYAGSGPAALPAAAGAAPRDHTVAQLVARLAARALREQPGDLLVFLPGAGEIRRVQALLGTAPEAQRVALRPLFGDLPPQEQDAALAPAVPGSRKVVLATNIAETSLTIDGVRVVVDSGLMRRARFDPVTGMSRLQTQRISRASAEQRRGRAGRTAAGVCYRAWSAGAHAALAAFTPAEILEADLAPLALELANWGARDAAELRWLDTPLAAMLASARDLLVRLGALEASGRISAHGRAMARLPVHPRLAHMLLRAQALGAAPLAVELAALLSERDLLRGATRDADIRTRLDLLRGDDVAGAIDRGALQRARRNARDLARQLQAAASDASPGSRARGGSAGGSGRGGTSGRGGEAAAAAVGLLLAFAYPDRIGVRRAGEGGGYTLANGRGALFAGPQALARQELLVALDVDDRDRDARILLAAPLDRQDLLQHFAAQLYRRERIVWDSRAQAVRARRTVELDALVLEDKPLTEVPADGAREAMLAGVRELGIAALPWDEEARALQARIGFVRAQLAPAAAAPWPEVSDAALLQSLQHWLVPWLEGMTRREHLARVPLVAALRALLTAEQQRSLIAWAPTHLSLPGGRRVRVDYLDASAPLVAVPLQEVFGLAASPRLGAGNIPVTFRLLSPARRPVQVTRDLASFWRGTYAEVRKDLRGRYPKHYWPEDPLGAPPTRGPRRAR